MNICDYIKEKKLPHTIDDNGNVVQKGVLYLSYKGITSLDGFIQNDELCVSYNNISSLKGFKQKGILFMQENKITSLDGFIQTDFLNLDFNEISSLEGFIQTKTISLRHNTIPNSDTTFTNPATSRVVYKMNDDLYGCGCFIGDTEKIIERCKARRFGAVLNHFNLV